MRHQSHPRVKFERQRVGTTVRLWKQAPLGVPRLQSNLTPQTCVTLSNPESRPRVQAQPYQDVFDTYARYSTLASRGKRVSSARKLLPCDQHCININIDDSRAVNHTRLSRSSPPSPFPFLITSSLSILALECTRGHSSSHRWLLLGPVVNSFSLYRRTRIKRITESNHGSMSA